MSGPRELVHRGHVRAGALRIEGDRIGEAEARRRVLAMWLPGIRVHSLGDALLVQLAEPVRLRADRAVGQVLTEAAGGWAACPGAHSGAGDVVRAVGGELRTESVGRAVDPASWLDLGAFEAISLDALAARPPAVVRGEASGPAAVDYGVGAPGAEAELLLKEIQAGVSRQLPWWAGAAKSLLAWIPRGRPESEPGPGTALAAPRPGLLERLAMALHLDLLLGSQASKLTQKLVDDLLSGDLQEALRRAIPLGDGARGGGFSLSMRLPFRTDLQVGRPSLGGGGSFLIDDGLFALLQRTYEQVAARLEREGQIEQAAYVLAELLNRADDAVKLCERHEKYGLAARIAEVRGLGPGVVVRLWVLAGEVKKALDVALLSGAFAEALYQLEASHPNEARVVRLRWGITLAEAGRHAAAVRLLEHLDGPPRFVWEIAELGIASGGPAAGELAVRRLSWGESEPAARYLEQLLCDGSDERRAERLGALEQLGRSDLPPAFARRGLRAAFREQQVTGPLVELTRALLDRAKDPALRADLPTYAVPHPTPLRMRSTDEPIELPSRGTGLRIFDVARLADGGLALALGDAGLRILDRRGTLRAHLEIPVERLVASRERNRLLALQDLGGSRTWRVDPRAGVAELWAGLELVASDRSYDGLTWLVATHDRVQLLDVSSGGPRSLWSVDLRAARGLAREGEWLRIEAEGELWTYQLGAQRNPVLRSRAPAPEGPAQTRSSSGAFGGIDPKADDLYFVQLLPGGNLLRIPLESELAAASVRAVGDDWLVHSPHCAVLVAAHLVMLRRVLTVQCAAGFTAVDVGERHLVLAARDGTVLELDLRSGQQRRIHL